MGDNFITLKNSFSRIIFQVCATGFKSPSNCTQFCCLGYRIRQLLVIKAIHSTKIQ